MTTILLSPEARAIGRLFDLVAPDTGGPGMFLIRGLRAEILRRIDANPRAARSHLLDFIGTVIDELGFDREDVEEAVERARFYEGA